MLIVSAIGSGKTSACIYPYLEQLLGYRASNAERKLGGLILEVKGDFCAHVRDILLRRGRADDYIEVSLTSRYRYNRPRSQVRSPTRQALLRRRLAELDPDSVH